MYESHLAKLNTWSMAWIEIYAEISNQLKLNRKEASTKHNILFSFFFFLFSFLASLSTKQWEYLTNDKNNTFFTWNHPDPWSSTASPLFSITNFNQIGTKKESNLQQTNTIQIHHKKTPEFTKERSAKILSICTTKCKLDE